MLMFDQLINIELTLGQSSCFKSLQLGDNSQLIRSVLDVFLLMISRNSNTSLSENNALKMGIAFLLFSLIIIINFTQVCSCTSWPVGSNIGQCYFLMLFVLKDKR